MFIYIIINSATGKYYIGQHKGGSLQKYLQQKISHASRGEAENSRLYNSMRKHPREVWSIYPLLSNVQTRVELDLYEREFINLLQSRDPRVGYNICRGGEGFTGPHSKETRQKMSVSHRGEVFSPERVANLRTAQQKIPHPELIPNFAKEMSGEVVNGVTIIERASDTKWKKAVWQCRCHCGNAFTADGTSLRYGHTKSCGCLKGGAVDMAGKVINGVVVIKRVANNKRGDAYWLCRCGCGKDFTVRGSHLRSGIQKTCGCANRN